MTNSTSYCGTELITSVKFFEDTPAVVGKQCYLR